LGGRELLTSGYCYHEPLTTSHSVLLTLTTDTDTATGSEFGVPKSAIRNPQSAIRNSDS
jgi:hypothetical protein